MSEKGEPNEGGVVLTIGDHNQGNFRVEALESSVSEVSDLMQQMTGMMSELMQAKPGGGGQEEKSVGAVSGAADGGETASDRDERQSHEGAGAVGTTAAAERGESNSSGSQAGNSSTRRPEVPAGVGPVYGLQGASDVDRSLGLAGNAAGVFGLGDAQFSGGNLGGGQLFRQQPQYGSRINPSVFKGTKDILLQFRVEFLQATKHLDLSDQFVGQRVRAVPVGDSLKSKSALMEERYSQLESIPLLRGGIFCRPLSRKMLMKQP